MARNTKSNRHNASSNSNALVKYAPQELEFLRSLQLTDRIPEGTEELYARPIQYPRLRLLQSVSTEVEEGEAQAGMLKHSATGEMWERIQVIILTTFTSRIYWDPNEPKSPPICYSMNARTAIEGRKCLEGDCPVRQKGKDPSQCDIVYNYPALILRDGKLKDLSLVALTFARSSRPAAHKLDTIVRSGFQSYWDSVFELWAKQRTFKRGTAWVFDLREVRKTTPEERAFAQSLYRAHRERGMEVALEEPAADTSFDFGSSS